MINLMHILLYILSSVIKFGHLNRHGMNYVCWNFLKYAHNFLRMLSCRVVILPGKWRHSENFEMPLSWWWDLVTQRHVWTLNHIKNTRGDITIVNVILDIMLYVHCQCVCSDEANNIPMICNTKWSLQWVVGIYHACEINIYHKWHTPYFKCRHNHP